MTATSDYLYFWNFNSNDSKHLIAKKDLPAKEFVKDMYELAPGNIILAFDCKSKNSAIKRLTFNSNEDIKNIWKIENIHLEAMLEGIPPIIPPI